MKYSVVIPVYNSEKIVGKTIDETILFFDSNLLDFEIILVNDGSTDGSWNVLKQKALMDERVKVFDLLKNYGQHTANFCGFKESNGDYLITMDDDLQNPPSEISKLINKIHDDNCHDVVFGKFNKKMHALHRKIGTRFVNYLNQKLFNKPSNVTITNFRVIRRDVVERICEYHTAYPYIPGLTIMFSANPGNTEVEHHPRGNGKSGYNAVKIIKLLMRILFNYSSYPLRFVTGLGFAFSFICFLLAGFYLLKAMFLGTSVAGWATVVVLLSFFNGITLLVIGMLGEYLIRLINQTSRGASYHVKESINA
ncbi:MULTISPECIES: glycosyltransferase [Desulfosediminicola]|uniref:glycosyltransferase n=1 Tax=Desulfosediminicola TaxID=2886823 RepID=UPI0010AC2428|nr:glycosyltransferase [Desulfosediminicola ganghwensis]